MAADIVALVSGLCACKRGINPACVWEYLCSVLDNVLVGLVLVFGGSRARASFVANRFLWVGYLGVQDKKGGPATAKVAGAGRTPLALSLSVELLLLLIV